MTFDLLREPLIQTDAGPHSLPGVLAAMARGEVQAFPALRPHQRPAWHMFLVQLSVMGLDAAGRRELPLDEADWRAALRALTPGFPADEPWHLVVADRTRPAFLQPADPGALKWSPVATPDALDMLITSRNHDVKREVARHAAPQDWVFALVSVQTMEGYQLKYSGISRMKSGASSRVLLGLAPAQIGGKLIDVSAWWRRDVEILMRLKSNIQNEKKILWIEPWQENAQLPFWDLHPLFIEVCRRVRVHADGSNVSGAEVSTVQKPRVLVPDDWVGNSGDPWAPVKADTGEALNLGEGDFDYSLLVELLVGSKKTATKRWMLPALASPTEGENDKALVLVASAFARGKGGKTRTDGFRWRTIPVPRAMVKELFGTRSEDVSHDVVSDISSVCDSLIRALRLVALSGDEEKLKKCKPSDLQKIDRRLGFAREALRRQADLLFFPELWKRMAVTEDAGVTPLRLEFLTELARLARVEFDRALPAIPCATLMRPRAETRGRAALERGLAKAMHELQPGGTNVAA